MPLTGTSYPLPSGRLQDGDQYRWNMSTHNNAGYGTPNTDRYYFYVSLPPVYYAITVSASPTVGGTVSGGGTFPAGSERTVTASANSGYTFVNWTESGTSVSTFAGHTFTLNANRALVANLVSGSLVAEVTRSESEWARIQTPGGGYNDGNWHFAALTYDGRTACLYIDGTKATSQAFGSWGGILYQPGGLAIGRAGDWSGDDFAGDIDDVRIFSRALSESEIAALAGDTPVASLTNGSLELPDVSAGTVLILEAGSSLLPGWQVGGTGGPVAVADNHRGFSRDACGRGPAARRFGSCYGVSMVR